MAGYFRNLSLVIIILSLIYIGLELSINVRIYDLERQDKSEEDGNYTMTQYTELMYLLSEGNLADNYGHVATLAYGFDKYVKEAPRSILEIGYGLGNFSIMLSKKYSSAKVVGIDSHAHSVTVANNYLTERKREDAGLWGNLSLEYRENPRLSEPDKQFDIIVTNFVNHHIFPDEEFELFLKQVGRVGSRYFIFNDFERSLFCIAANHLLFSSLKKFGANVVLDLASKYSPFSMSADAIVSLNAYKRILDSGLRSKESLDLLYDGGMLSMRRSSSMREYKEMFKRAGYPEDSLKCHSMFNPLDPISYTCRVVCVVDLSGYNA